MLRKGGDTILEYQMGSAEGVYSKEREGGSTGKTFAKLKASCPPTQGGKGYLGIKGPLKREKEKKEKSNGARKKKDTDGG